MTEMIDIAFDIESLEDKGTGGVSKFKTEKIKEGVSYFRILPPYGLNHGRTLSHKYMVHWGFIGTNGKERSYTCSRPTEGFCPVCQKVWDSDEEKKRAEQAGDESRVKELESFIMQFRARKFFIYNAVALSGQIVKLELPSTAHEALGKKITELVKPTAPGAKGFDPTNIDTGVWFEFKREGKGLMTRYSVDLRRIWVDVNGEQLSKIDRSPLSSVGIPEDVIQQIKDQVTAAKLGNLADGPMADVHAIHEPMSSQDLRGLMNGITPIQKTVSAPVNVAPAVNFAGGTNSIPRAAMTKEEVHTEVERLKRLQSLAEV